MSRYRKGTRLTAPDGRQSGPTIQEAIEEFLSHHRRKGSSPRYLEELTSYLVGAGHRTSWLPLSRWAASHGLHSVLSLQRVQLSSYLEEVQAKTTATVYFKVCSIVSLFLNFLLTEEHIPSLPMVITKPRRLKPEIRAFTSPEVQRLAEVVKRENTRDWAIFVLLLDTGIRAGELCSLRIQDVRFDRRELCIRASVAKSRRTRIIPLGASIGALRAYLRLRTTASEPADAFFLAYYSTPVFAGGSLRAARRPTKAQAPFSTSPLTRVGLYQLVRKWGRLAALREARCSPHTFRHYFATQFLCRGGDIVSLQQILGHSRLDVTERYLRMTTYDIKLAHERSSPANTVIRPRARRTLLGIHGPGSHE